MSAIGIPASFFRALRFQDPDVEALQNITDAEWERILGTWSTARIMTSFWLDHREHDRDGLPHWVGQKIDQYLADIDLRFHKVKSVYARAAHELNRAGAEHVVIKGFSLFPGYTRRFGLRPQGDIDLYCPPEALNRAQGVLSGQGFVTAPEQDGGASDHLPIWMPSAPWKPGGNIFDPKMPIGFELHFCFWNEEYMRLRAAGADEFWSRRIQREIDGFEFTSLHPVDNLGYTSLNILRDLSRGFGLPSMEQVHGLARFLHTQSTDANFWESWRELHAPSLRRLEAISFQLAANWFGCDVAPEVQEDVDRLPAAIQTWFRETSRSGLYTRSDQAKNGAWLHVLLLESFKDKVKAVREVLFSVGTPPKIVASDIPERHTAEKQSKGGILRSLRSTLSYPNWLVSRSIVRITKFPAFFRLGFRLWFSRFDLSKSFWQFFAASFFFDLGMFIFFVLYNLYLMDRGLKENVLGLVASASAIGGIAGAIPAGLLAHRFGLRKALLTCLTLVPLTFALRAFPIGENLLIALAFVGGAVITIWAVCISPAIAQLTNEKSRPIGFSTIFSSGIAIGILGGQVGGRLPGWVGTIASATSAARTKQMALFIACALVAVGLLPLWKIKFSASPTKERNIYPSGRFIGRYLVAIAVWTLAVGAFDPFFNVYFSQHLHMPLEEIGSLFSYAQLSQVIAIMVSPMVFRKFGMVEGIAYIQIAAAITLGILATCTRAPMAAVTYVGYMALHWMTEPGMMLLLMNRVAPEERTGASALNFLVINIAGAIATATAGAAFSRFGYPLVLTVTSIIAVVAAFVFRLMLGERRGERIPEASLSSRTIS